jgi:hypothetical protein
MSTFISLVLLFSQFGYSSGTRVLFEKDGALTYGTVDAIKANAPTSPKLIVSMSGYSKNGIASNSAAKVPREQLTFEVPQIQTTLQERSQSIKKGIIVLGTDKKPYLVEAVFPGDKVVLTPLKADIVSRFRIAGSNFSPVEGKNVRIALISDILAVEEQCFLKEYCKGKTITKVADIPICEAYAIRIKAPRHLQVRCGGANGESASIHAAFSDGTLLLHNTLINPFPDSTWKYAPEPAVPAAN